ncbi:hypothetical protein [Nocardia arthritidis]|uniref:Ribbon-helix-helix protein, CopG family n=1 Tax=Nocardia arthritidis TaxID=228602 RepID=A0A6G9YJ73_9NOCA|nr:hypothetical protein [Nocardia arthritidis]QIS13117.1 hypothetical protein F5544_26315 [Nocardia arthritidis]
MSKAARVTVTLDPQVAEWARQAAQRQNRSLSALVNAAVRTALVQDSLARLVIDEEAERAAAYAELRAMAAAEEDDRRHPRGAA